MALKTCKRCKGLGIKRESMTIPVMNNMHSISFSYETITINTICKSCYGKGMK